MRLKPVDRARAALAVGGTGAFVSHHTAAELWGGHVPHTENVHVSVPIGQPRTERQGIKAHQALAANSVSTNKVATHRGLPLSTPIQCFLELAAVGANLVELVVLGDCLVGQWRRDARRREVLDREGWRMIVVHSDGIYIDPADTLERVRSLLVELGAATNLPRVNNPEWRRYIFRDGAACDAPA